MVNITPRDLGDGVRVITGIIRLYQSGPEFMDDWSHARCGVQTVGIDPVHGMIEVTHNHDGFRQVVLNAVAFPDETLVARGIAAGCSGGVGRTLIRLAEDGNALDLRKPSHYDKVKGNGSNLWFRVEQYWIAK